MNSAKNSTDLSDSSADWLLSRSDAHAPGMPIISILGDGQLARMMQQAGIELGWTIRLLAANSASSAAQATADVVVGDYTQLSHVTEVVMGISGHVPADAVSFDHEHVPPAIIDSLLEQGINVQPQPSALIYAQDKLLMRKKLRELGAPVPPFAEISSVDDALGFYEAVSGDICVKSCRGGYDGKGVWFPASVEELEDLVTGLLEQGVALMAEKKVALVRELSAVVARRPSGETKVWPVVESVQKDGICYETIVPAPRTLEWILDKAQRLAVDIAQELGVTGVCAVELFETRDEQGQPEIIVNELAMRPHNTGHWTQDGAVTSQFEQHLRAVVDMPLGDSSPTAPATVMANVLGGDADPDMPMPERMAQVWARFPQAKIHLYGKDWRPQRKMGHVNLSLSHTEVPSTQNIDRLRAQARLAANFLVNARWDDEDRV